jgi:hypothetical protein
MPMRRAGSVVRWWATKTRQFARHVTAGVRASERAELDTWLRPSEARLFDAMHIADRRHGLDVVATLRRDGVVDRDLLVAGLLHDAGKGNTGVWPRVAWSLGELLGEPLASAVAHLPGMRVALDRLRDHAAASAQLAEAAGCSPRTVVLIRHQSQPIDRAGEALLEADEAN